ncbi:succinate-semialdehyde dehydrogenase, mitochondrial isoform X2 [Bactrocera oleae]|uniref:succinate-semialdehyde dehydrogenase, mitochondrial isoform X2 n=1 Tax=Bactrocera oleae TaxID=104688 RepID=UPI00387ECAA6
MKSSGLPHNEDRARLSLIPFHIKAKLVLLDTKPFSSLVQSKAFINGNWINASCNKTFEVINPANGSVVGSVPNMDVNDAALAIQAAKNAFEQSEWPKFTAKERSSLLKKWFHMIDKNVNEISSIMSAESGKPIHEARGEVAYGCTIVIKPAEDTPLTALALVKLAEEAGFPDGVINIVTTNNAAPIGDLFCKSPDVKGISFTGSTEVGKWLFRNSSDGIKRISLELGGNAPFIVFNTANLEKAADAAIASKFRNCGQTCVSANRFFLQHEIHDKFIDLIKQRVESLKVGDGSKPDVQIGPLINNMQFKKVSSYVEDARSKGAEILFGGNPLEKLGKLFYSPTIISNVPANAKLYTEEVFGPVVSIVKFKTEEEVIHAANNSRRGLAGYFFSENIQQVFRVARLLEVGMVGVNEGLISAAEAPFGGVKESGIGREGSHHGIDEYVEIKYICMGNLKY